MKYGTKRLNRRRYKKRLSRKRLTGGSNQDVDNIMNNIDKQNEIEIPEINDIPVIGPVIEKTGNLVEGSLSKGLDVLGDSIGVDIDNPESIGQKLDSIKNAVSDPENIEKGKEILNNAGKYVEVGIEAAAPVIEKTADKVFPVFTKEADKAVRAGLNTMVNIAEDFVGPIVGIPRTILSATKAFNASVNAGSELVKGTAEAIQGTQENFERLSSGGIPEFQSPKMPELQNPKMQEFQTGGAKSMKLAQKQAHQIGGRILKSQMEFLTPHKLTKKYRKHSHYKSRRR